MAPVSPTTRGHGVPGGLSSEPGMAHFYLSSNPYLKNQFIRSVKASDEFEAPSEALGFHCARRNATVALRAHIPSGAFHSQVSHANKTKRGLYVYQA
jgi:hypothetical protein